MRETLVYSRVPTHLLTLYTKSFSKQKKKNKPSVLLAPDNFQLQTIRDLAKTLPKELLMILPQLSGKIDQFEKIMAGTPILSPIPSYGEYICKYVHATDGNPQHLLLCRVGGENTEFLASGTTAELFVAAMRFYKNAIKSVVAVSREHYIPGWSGDTKISVDDALAQYRFLRTLSPGLNAITKADQLSHIGKSLTLFKFWDITCSTQDVFGDCVMHYGSGNESSYSELGLPDHVINFDSIIKETHGRYHSNAFNEIDLVPESSIISDMSFGNVQGMIPIRNQNSVLRSMLSHSDKYDTVLRIKLDVSQQLDFPCVLFSKVLPHNLEVVVDYDPNGRSFRKLASDLHPSIYEANDVRTARFIRQEISDVRKTLYYHLEHLQIVSNKHTRFGRVVAARIASVSDRYRNLFADTTTKKYMRRRLQFNLACTKEIDTKTADWVKLPPETISIGKVSSANDQLIGSPEFSLVSFLKSANSYGFPVYYSSGTGWTIGPRM